MTFPMEYHHFVNRPVQRSIQALPAIFGLLLIPIPLILVIGSAAQNNGASATSSSSYHSVSVAPPTGTIAPPTGTIAPPRGSIAPPTGSVAPPTGLASVHSGFAPSNSGVSHSNKSQHSPGGSHNSGEHSQPHHNGNGDAYYYPYVYGVAVPYAADATDAAGNNNGADNDPESADGPAVFDPSDADSYVATLDPEAEDDDDAPESAADLTAAKPQPSTILVFKDGHQLEIENYAIVSQTLYDLTPGHPRKIALADLDLASTEKQNDDRGVTFQLPSLTQAN